MNEYTAGDLVEAVKGESVIRGRLQRDTCAGDLYMHGWCIEPLRRDGFTITVIEKAAPVVVLPTEPGLYSASRFPVEDDYAPYRLSKAGTWNEVGTRPRDAKFMGKAGTLTRLEPVPETAKKLLDRVLSYWDFEPPANISIALSRIAKEFGAEL